MKKKSIWGRLGDFLMGKGFYMVLLLCVLAIGGSGYYLYHLATTPIPAEEAQVSASAQAEVEQGAAASEEDPEVSQSLADALAQAEAEARQTEAAAQAALEAAESGTLVPEAESGETPETPGEETSAEPEPDPAEEAAVEPEPAREAAAEPARETAGEVEEEGTPTLAPPVPGEAVAAFSDSQLTYNAALEDWRTHNGVDLAAQLGDPVYAALEGEVLEIRSDLFLGTTVTLNHGDGLITVYGNLSEAVPVTSGERVEAGQVIGTVGNTAAGEAHEGAWLHFAVEQDGVLVDPADYLGE